jgi:GTP1/Obg family GTP-binding protein
MTKEGERVAEKERRINTAVEEIVAGGQDALEEMQDVIRDCVQLMIEHDQLPDILEPIGEIVEISREVIKRAENRIEKEGKDRISLLLSQRE